MQQSHLYVYLSALYVVTADVEGQLLNLSAERLAHTSGSYQISKESRGLVTTNSD
jgi:hypothetical protein